MGKTFKIPGDQIRSIAPGHGSCIASDAITVGGRPVGFMYREQPSDGVDSGWRFMAGDESQDFMDEPRNLEIYEVNTIANYDPDIVLHLGSPTGSAFERSEAGVLVAVAFAPPED
jgi:hypothetical protein